MDRIRMGKRERQIMEIVIVAAVPAPPTCSPISPIAQLFGGGACCLSRGQVSQPRCRTARATSTCRLARKTCGAALSHVVQNLLRRIVSTRVAAAGIETALQEGTSSVICEQGTKDRHERMMLRQPDAKDPSCWRWWRSRSGAAQKTALRPPAPSRLLLVSRASRDPLLLPFVPRCVRALPRWFPSAHEPSRPRMLAQPCAWFALYRGCSCPASAPRNRRLCWCACAADAPDSDAMPLAIAACASAGHRRRVESAGDTQASR